MTLIGTISVFICTRSAWTQAMLSHPPVAAVISVRYAGILVCGVLALAVRGRRAPGRCPARRTTRTGIHR
ncbi:hypothetical protein ABT075_02100 [Streptomyces sp. NPDC002677]|uniref:hypothetical protein n=1 Tax=Streptomyces sp. NPDC002677 TaxID=3154774 RepID=UPI003323750A